LQDPKVFREHLLAMKPGELNDFDLSSQGDTRSAGLETVLQQVGVPSTQNFSLHKRMDKTVLSGGGRELSGRAGALFGRLVWETIEVVNSRRLA
jgi:hypothetical protein